MRAAGLNITGTTQPRAAGFLSGLNTVILFSLRSKSESWQKLQRTPVSERLALIKDQAFREQLIQDGKAMELAEHIGQTLSSPKFGLPCTKTFWMGNEDRPNYAHQPDQSLAHIAAAAGEHPVETWLRLQLESEGKGFFHVRFVNEDLTVLPNYMGADWVVPGVGDAGAHVSMIMDAGWTSFFISHWYRDTGTYSLEETIHMLTAKQNRVLGLADRGALAVGKKADINVLDINRVEERQPVRVEDFPGNAPRLIQRGVGYRQTLVNGKVILENNELTGIRNGVMLRNNAGT
jgi:N-acyl-D-aspartate/D-glutamate deacylase